MASGFQCLLAPSGRETPRNEGLMQAYIVRRLLALIPTLFFASLIVFVTVRLIPGDVIDLMLSQNDISADKMSRDQLDRGARPRQADVGAIPAAGWAASCCAAISASRCGRTRRCAELLLRACRSPSSSA